jgi:pimeloyl-ACP methyl ester carboxylesterase
MPSGTGVARDVDVASLGRSRLSGIRPPTLVIIGDHEVVCDPAMALARARHLFRDVQGELVPQSSHDMCFSQRGIVDARVLDFLKRAGRDDRRASIARSLTQFASGSPERRSPWFRSSW